MKLFTEANEENKDSNPARYRPFLRFLLLVRNQGTSQKDFLQKAAKETKICSFCLLQTFVIFASFC